MRHTHYWTEPLRYMIGHYQIEWTPCQIGQ